MALHVRPLESDDLERLGELDRAYGQRHGLDPVLTRGSVAFFVRSGHAFVAADEREPRGFALAQAVWDGTRPTLRVQRLAVAPDGDRAVTEALVEAVTKSAYDAAVYDLVAELPNGDVDADRALRERRWVVVERRLFERRLGSRGSP